MRGVDEKCIQNFVVKYTGRRFFSIHSHDRESNVTVSEGNQVCGVAWIHLDGCVDER